MEKKWTWDSWSQITKPDGCHCDEAEIERFKEAPVLERKVKNMMLLWTSLIGSIVRHKVILMKIYIDILDQWSPPRGQKEAPHCWGRGRMPRWLQSTSLHPALVSVLPSGESESNISHSELCSWAGVSINFKTWVFLRWYFQKLSFFISKNR